MSDEKDIQDESTEDQKEEKQAVTIEQLEKLQAQLEETKKAQSGSDRTVKELQDKLKQRELDAADDKKTAAEKFADRLATLEKDKLQAEEDKLKANQKSLAMGLLNDKGIKAPAYLNRLLGKDDEETEAKIEEYIKEKLEDQLAIADQFARNNGRKVNKGKTDVKTLDDYTDEEIDSMSQEEFLKVQERSK